MTTHSYQQTTQSRTEMLNKVPEVTFYFWVIEIMATIAGAVRYLTRTRPAVQMQTASESSRRH